MTEKGPTRAEVSPIWLRWVILIPVLLIGIVSLRQEHRNQLESSKIAGEEARAIEAAPIIGAMRAARIAQGFTEVATPLDDLDYMQALMVRGLVDLTSVRDGTADKCSDGSCLGFVSAQSSQGLGIGSVGVWAHNSNAAAIQSYDSLIGSSGGGFNVVVVNNLVLRFYTDMGMPDEDRIEVAREMSKQEQWPIGR
jgi:hypothetical protein